MMEARVYDACAQTCGKMQICLQVGVLAGCNIPAKILSVRR